MGDFRLQGQGGNRLFLFWDTATGENIRTVGDMGTFEYAFTPNEEFFLYDTKENYRPPGTHSDHPIRSRVIGLTNATDFIAPGKLYKTLNNNRFITHLPSDIAGHKAGYYLITPQTQTVEHIYGDGRELLISPDGRDAIYIQDGAVMRANLATMEQ
ncbi:MAG: hypothetical protein AAF202_11000 [Pseudomonadota bacterium]